jgi:hypothetical protein
MTSSNPMLSSYLANLAFGIPFLLFCIVGVILVALRWRDHPGPSRLALIALIVLLFNAVVMPFASSWLANSILEQGFTVARLSASLKVIAVVRNLLLAIGLGLLLLAVYIGRSAVYQSRAERVRDQDFPFDRPRRYPEEVLPANDAPDTSIRERKE